MSQNPEDRALQKQEVVVPEAPKDADLQAQVSKLLLSRSVADRRHYQIVFAGSALFVALGLYFTAYQMDNAATHCVTGIAALLGHLFGHSLARKT